MSHSDTQKLFNNLRFIIVNNVPELENLRQLILENGGEVQIALDNFHELPEQLAHPDHIYIVDKFEGELFKYLTEMSAKIIGVPFIYQTVAMKRPAAVLESIGPLILYSRVMEGIEICATRLRREKREDVKKMIQYMGGTYRDEITSSTQILLAGKVGSVKYQIAISRNLPVLDPTWILKCWDTQTLVDYHAYILPPFAGLLICVTGLSSSTRDEIQRLTKSYGGDYTPNLSRKVTHLIAEKPTGIKYRYALEWGIFCVSMDWFFDSINSQVCVDERHYFLPVDEGLKDVLSGPSSSVSLKQSLSKLRRRQSPFSSSQQDPLSNSRFNSYSMYAPPTAFRPLLTIPKPTTTPPYPSSTETTPLSTFNFVVRPVSFSLSLSPPTSSTTPFTTSTTRLPVNCLPNSLVRNPPLSSFLRVPVYPHPNRYRPYTPPPLFRNHSTRVPTSNFQGIFSENANKNTHNNNNNNNNTNNDNSDIKNVNFIPLQSPQPLSLQTTRVSSPIKASYLPSIRKTKKRKQKSQTSQSKCPTNKRISVALPNQTINTKRNEETSTILAPSSSSTNFSNLSTNNIPRMLHTDNTALVEQILNGIMKAPNGSEILADFLRLIQMCDDAIHFYRSLEKKDLDLLTTYLETLRTKSNNELTLCSNSENYNQQTESAHQS